MSKPNRLKEQRKASRLTMAEVAKVLEVTEATVSRHESGQRSLSGEMIEKYCELYKCEPSELFV